LYVTFILLATSQCAEKTLLDQTDQTDQNRI
jgi:hypothetical protein